MDSDAYAFFTWAVEKTASLPSYEYKSGVDGTAKVGWVISLPVHAENVVRTADIGSGSERTYTYVHTKFGTTENSYTVYSDASYIYTTQYGGKDRYRKSGWEFDALSDYRNPFLKRFDRSVIASAGIAKKDGYVQFSISLSEAQFKSYFPEVRAMLEDVLAQAGADSSSGKYSNVRLIYNVTNDGCVAGIRLSFDMSFKYGILNGSIGVTVTSSYTNPGQNFNVTLPDLSAYS